MRLVTFSDIHGNLHALLAVLDDISQQHPDAVYCLGDLIGYGAFPNEVIDLVRSTGYPTIMGNYDDGVGFDRDTCGYAYRDAESRHLGDLNLMWTKDAVTPENKAFLRGLLKEVRFDVSGKRVLLVHGSPRKINEYLFEDRPRWSFEHLARDSSADLIVCGHTHMPYTKDVNGVLFVNDGSVGKPKDGDARAGYAVIDISAKRIEVVFRRVPYDVEAAASAVRASGLPMHYADVLCSATG
jgi:putative phosphoesterase